MRYLPKSDSERREMLEVIGVSSTEELFSHVTKGARLNRQLNLAPGISEYEIVDYFRARANETANGYVSFLGAGVGTGNASPNWRKVRTGASLRPAGEQSESRSAIRPRDGLTAEHPRPAR